MKKMNVLLSVSLLLMSVSAMAADAPSTVPVNDAEYAALLSAPLTSDQARVLTSDAVEIYNCAAVPNAADRSKTVVCSLNYMETPSGVMQKGWVMYHTNGYRGTITQASLQAIHLSAE